MNKGRITKKVFSMKVKVKCSRGDWDKDRTQVRKNVAEKEGRTRRN
jgi:hypothetical protein